MLDSIEKARKTLSGDDEAEIRVDSLLKDEDIERMLSREEFSTII